MDKSVLGKLPGELRNQLYELILADDAVVVCIDEHGTPEDAAKNRLAIRSTCKQVRQETEGFPLIPTTTIILKSA